MLSNIQLLDVAKKQLGNTGGKYRKYVGQGGSWCDMFAFWLYDANGCGSLLTWKGNQRYYCPASIQWCNKHLAMIPIYLAMPCDIIYFDWDKNGRPNHVGIVESKVDTGSIKTIEGNTNGGKVARKTRPVKYIQGGVYRPFFKGNFKDKPLVIDGDFQYQSIGGLQKALKMLGYYSGSIDTIMGQGTIRGIQKLCGAKPVDGAWGANTSGQLQKYLKAKGYYTGKIDKAFGKQSVMALQKFINANAYQTKPSAPKPTPQPTQPTQPPQPTAPTVNPKALKAVEWGRAIAKSGKYKYKKWNSKNKNTKLCPICHPGSGNGWNCIGFVSACYKHGGGIPVTCSCSGIGTDSFFDKVTEASWKKRNGNDWVMISNGGKKGGASIPASKLLPGDCVICYDKNGKFKHIVIYSGDGKFLESTNGKKPNIAERNYADLIKAKHATRAFRYTG